MLEKTQNSAITIYMEANPNPNSLKFAANKMLIPEGESFDFPTVESAEHAPLAKALLERDDVDRVFYMSNFVTVTKKGGVEWIEIQNDIRTFIRDYIAEGKPLLTETGVKEAIAKGEAEDSLAEGDEVIGKIKEILDEYIKPAVEQDGGAITFDSFENGKVRVALQGACSGCPSSMITLKAGIENLMKRMLPNDVTEVEAIGM